MGPFRITGSSDTRGICRGFCQVFTRKAGGQREPLLGGEGMQAVTGGLAQKPAYFPRPLSPTKPFSPWGRRGNTPSQSPGKEPSTASGEKAEVTAVYPKLREPTSWAQDRAPTQSRNRSKTCHRRVAEFGCLAGEGRECWQSQARRPYLRLSDRNQQSTSEKGQEHTEIPSVVQGLLKAEDGVGI